MLKKTITYKNLDGQDVTRDFYFNLTKAELVEMNFEHAHGMEEWIQEIIASNDGSRILAVFKRIVMNAYGVRHEGGERFIKSPEGALEFLETGAWDELFMELLTNATAAAEFIKGIMPADLAENMPDIEDVTDITTLSNGDGEIVATIEEKPWANREPTRAELVEMSREDLLQVFARRTRA